MKTSTYIKWISVFIPCLIALSHLCLGSGQAILQFEICENDDEEKLENGLLVAYDQLIEFYVEDSYQTLLHVREQIEDWDAISEVKRAHWHYLMSYVQLREQNFREAWVSISEAEETGSRDSAFLGKILYMKGKILTIKGQLLQAESALIEAERLLRKYLPQDEISLANLYAAYGNYHIGIGEGQLAFDYYNQAIEILQRRRIESSHLFSLMAHVGKSNAVKILGIIAASKGDREEARQLLQSSLDIIDSVLMALPAHETLRKDEMIIHKATALFPFRRFDEMYDILSSVEKKYEGRQDLPASFCYLYEAMAALHIDYRKELDIGRLYAQKAIDIQRTYYQERSLSAPPTFSIATYFFHKRMLDSSLYYIQLAQARNSLDWKPSSPQDFPDAKQVLSWRNWAQIHPGNAEVLLQRYDSTQQVEDAIAAYQGFRKCYEYLPYILTEVDDKSSQGVLPFLYRSLDYAVFARKRISSPLPKDIDLFQEEFFAAEYNRSISMLNEVRKKQSFGLLPDSLQNTLNTLRRKLQEIRKQKALQTVSPDHVFLDDQALVALEFDLSRQLNALLDELRDRYPAFDQKQKNVSIPTLPTIQTYLEDQSTTLLSYYLSDSFPSTVRIFVVTGEQRISLDVQSDQAISQLVADWRNRLLLPNADSLDAHTYASILHSDDRLAALSHQLYQLLIQPVQDTLGDELTERLVIIPHKSLEYIPFDLLLTAPVDSATPYQKWPYSLHQYAISYGYSAARWYEANTKPYHAPSRQTLIMTPLFEYAERPTSMPQHDAVFTSRDGQVFQYLDNVSAAQHIAEQFPKAKWLEGQAARKQYFLEEAPLSRLIYLPIHALSDFEQPELSFLAFSNPDDWVKGERLYLSDIYGMRIDAEMVSISACETGIGRLERGEGFASISRAFRTIGARSVISTLWKVPDQEAEEIMQDFFSLLKSGMAKDQAMRQAKRTHITSMNGFQNRSHPLYWASFITYGNHQAIQSNRRWWAWGLLGLILPLGIVLIFQGQSSIGNRKP